MQTAQPGQDLDVETWTPNSLSSLGTAGKEKSVQTVFIYHWGEQQQKINSQNVKRNKLETSDAKHKGELKTHTIKAFE